MRKNSANVHRVAVLALDGVMPFELGIAGRVFGAAFDAAGQPLYEVVTCSLDGKSVTTSLDFAIVVEHGPEALAGADTVVLPPSAEPLPEGALPDGLVAALTGLKPGARLLSICTASFTLAAVGLLDGRAATTHWAFTEQFAARFPAVTLDPGVLFVDDGDVLTAAGASAGIDLCLHVVRRDHGSEIANQVARRCVVQPYRDGGQRQFVDRPLPDLIAATTTPTRAWALEQLSLRLTLDQMALHAHMSTRTFTRRFREETGVSPSRWLLQQRLELARRLLETSRLSVERIAAEAGFGTATSLRQHFRRTIGVSPSVYRQAFQA
ncbi:MAG: hypothetical protein QOI44_1477 [Actinomycetota bacterium]|jgi:transcriptional regulator GlxA family with amidase domain|nr:hypothetical protein [Actinomycetota bacterium]